MKYIKKKIFAIMHHLSALGSHRLSNHCWKPNHVDIDGSKLSHST